MHEYRHPCFKLWSLSTQRLIPCYAMELINDSGAASAVSLLVRLVYDCLHADRHIDCAAAYGNENVVGEAFGNVFKEGKITRKDVWITSKLNNPDHGRVREACQQTIKELQAEYLDLYLMHWPLTGNKGKEVEPPIKVSVKSLLFIRSCLCACPWQAVHCHCFTLTDPTTLPDTKWLGFRTPGKKWKSW